MIKGYKKYSLGSSKKKKKKKRAAPKRKVFKKSTRESRYVQIKNFYDALQNPQKYCGATKQVEMRSSYEIKYAIRLDNSPYVAKWSSEDIVIKYKKPDGRYHNYYTDFYIKFTSGKEYIIEVKPLTQTKQPIPTEYKSTISYKRAAYTFAVNMAKWKATEQYCIEERAKGRRIQFGIVTESELINEDFRFKKLKI